MILNMLTQLTIKAFCALGHVQFEYFAISALQDADRCLKNKESKIIVVRTQRSEGYNL